MSKGDSPRPHDPAKYRSEWERIFEKSRDDALREHTQLWEDEYGRDPAREKNTERGEP